MVPEELRESTSLGPLSAFVGDGTVVYGAIHAVHYLVPLIGPLYGSYRSKAIANRLDIDRDGMPFFFKK